MFMGRSITTQQWKDHLYDYFQNHGGQEKVKLLDSVDWNVGNSLLAWLPNLTE